MRNIPDVAMVGDNVYINYGNGSSTMVGGTSCAAPLWAGFLALVNQQATAGGTTNGMGFVNPAIYEIANESIYNAAFNDITTGSNTWPSSPNLFYAVPGYDLCTGVGTPAGTNLINALVNPDPLIVISNGGFNAVGSSSGTFNIASQTFYLTNAGAFSLTWSLINTSNTPAQNLIDEYNQMTRASMTTHEAKAMKDLRGELTKLAQAGDEEGFAEKAKATVEEGKLTRQQIKSIEEESKAPRGVGRFVALPLEWAARAWEQASDYEKEQWWPYFLKKIKGSKIELLIRNRDALIPIMEEKGLPDFADQLRNLVLPEEATEFDLTGLGVARPAAEMPETEDLDAEMSQDIEDKLAKMGLPARPKGYTANRPGTKKQRPAWVP